MQHHDDVGAQAQRLQVQVFWFAPYPQLRSCTIVRMPSESATAAPSHPRTRHR
jgi:hypothetical protein